MASKQKDKKAEQIIRKYTWGVAAAMVVIPVPGADMAATFAVWAKMIMEIAKVYGYETNAEDAKKLAGELFTGVVLTSVAWFASAKTASTVLKFIPGAGTVTAYLVDAAIAGFGAKKITATLGTAAALYYKSEKTAEMKDIQQSVKEVIKNPKNILATLALKK
ncbi:MAG: DUF697 domain-containing protein [Pseudobdellovibrio sp.]